MVYPLHLTHSVVESRCVQGNKQQFEAISIFTRQVAHMWYKPQKLPSAMWIAHMEGPGHSKHVLKSYE